MRRHRLRSLLASQSLLRVLAALAGALLALSLLAGLGFWLLGPQDPSFLSSWYRGAVVMLGGDPGGTLSASEKGVYLAARALNLLLFGVFLGAVVYKVLQVDDVFQLRRSATVGWDERGPMITLRLYNATSLTIVDCRFAVYLRAPEDLPDGKRRVRNRQLEVSQDVWPISQPGVPYSLRLPLRDGDVILPGGDLVSIQSHTLPEKWRLAVLITGSIPKLGADLSELYWVKSRDVCAGGISDIEVDYRRPPGEWHGWPEFDEVPQMDAPQFLFGFGSLVSDADTAPTRELSLLGYVADLHDYLREWGVAMDNRVDIPGYKYYVEGGRGEPRPDVAVAFLDIREAPGGIVNGVCQPTSDAELKLYDQRERNYGRIDVTAKITPRPPGTVWAYVGTRESRMRARVARREGRLVVQASYKKTVEDGFRELGDDEWAAYRRSTDAPSCRVEPLIRRDVPSVSATPSGGHLADD